MKIGRTSKMSRITSGSIYVRVIKNRQRMEISSSKGGVSHDERGEACAVQDKQRTMPCRASKIAEITQLSLGGFLFPNTGT